MSIPKPRTSSAYSSKAQPLESLDPKSPTTTISLRLPKVMLDELKQLAKQRDVPYHSLLKVFLSDRMVAERWRLQPAAQRHRR